MTEENYVNMGYLLKNNHNTRKKYRDTFHQIFGTGLEQFWDNIFGFDICKFDNNFLQTPDGKSLDEYVEEKYGKKGKEVIDNITNEHCNGIDKPLS